MKLKIISLAAALSMAASHALPAQPRSFVLSRPSANLVRLVIESEGLDKLAKFSFNEQPVCSDYKNRY